MRKATVGAALVIGLLANASWAAGAPGEDVKAPPPPIEELIRVVRADAREARESRWDAWNAPPAYRQLKGAGETAIPALIAALGADCFDAALRGEDPKAWWQDPASRTLLVTVRAGLRPLPGDQRAFPEIARP